jgi:hypothetical protein
MAWLARWVRVLSKAAQLISIVLMLERVLDHLWWLGSGFS